MLSSQLGFGNPIHVIAGAIKASHHSRSTMNKSFSSNVKTKCRHFVQQQQQQQQSLFVPGNYTV